MKPSFTPPKFLITSMCVQRQDNFSVCSASARVEMVPFGNAERTCMLMKSGVRGFAASIQAIEGLCFVVLGWDAAKGALICFDCR